MKRIGIVCFSLVIVAFISSSQEIKIACVGDSITEGYGLVRQSKTAYPVLLNKILGSGYSVLNSGRSATALQKKGDFPYWTCKEFTNVFVFKPNIIIIALGTNDTKGQNWKIGNFAKDYQALIDTFKTIPGKPKIFVCLPVPVYKTKWGINDSTITNGIIPILEKLAQINNLPIIDLYHQMGDQSENFPDGIHPNEKGVELLAEIVGREIKKK